jgi:hypothetical protein
MTQTRDTLVPVGDDLAALAHEADQRADLILTLLSCHESTRAGIHADYTWAHRIARDQLLGMARTAVQQIQSHLKGATQ